MGHLTGTGGFPHMAAGVAASLAHLGVVCFFCISGFLITTLLVNEERAFGDVSLRNFYARRALRILPAFLVFAGCMLLARSMGLVEFQDRDAVYALTWTSNYQLNRGWIFGHTWSLSIEEQFYLLWPLAVATLAALGRLRLVTFMFLVGPLVRTAMRLAFHNSVRDLEIFPATADAIAIGAAFALQREALLSNTLYARISSARYAMPLAMAAFLIERYSDYTIIDLLLGPVKLLAIATLVEGSTRYVGAGRAILNWRPIAWIGTLSYSLYLWQQPFLNRSAHLPWNQFPANLALAVGAACMSLYLVEKPILRFSRYFRRR